MNLNDSCFIEGFHTSLRKYCDSSSAWGLWQWISFTADNKEFRPVNALFWNAMYSSFRLHLKKKEDCKKNKQIINSFIQNLDSSEERQAVLENENSRRLFYMMRGLVEGLSIQNDIESISLMLINCNFHKENN